MVQYIFANLIASLLRPLVWAALRVAAVVFVITVPARLWTLYVDPRPGALVVRALTWGVAAVVAVGWLLVVAGRRHSRAHGGRSRYA